ncbi:hypothetical protein JDV02_008216 [Purpureocillium takamizusanense]|uniref:Phosphoglycerate mutase family protein n=1 Tax=Purpureocillium takamizusanense TaxID=2060973 RepID=A0A9Q8QN76_9HYPO|nr:uncharacterized protein JDV02_008216 [Purpureocillium takamizusanense]UNI22317.1 hypothetical protein JDV02_008216 [Purpureocillium takamizusanense]
MKLGALVLLASAAFAAAKPTVYLIRHGEKPADGGNGLSDKGKQRAECLRKVFGASSPYNIGHIMAQTPQSDGSRARPRDTVKPLAADLGIKIDVSCDRDDTDCVQDVVDGYKGQGNILICWEHKQLNNIAEALGAKKVDNYPDDAFNIIWTQPAPYNKIVKVSSEDCPGLDSH